MILNIIIVYRNLKMSEGQGQEDSCLEIFRSIHERNFKKLKEIAETNPERFNCEMSLTKLNTQLELELDKKYIFLDESIDDLNDTPILPLEFALKWSFLFDKEYVKDQYNNAFYEDKPAECKIDNTISNTSMSRCQKVQNVLNQSGNKNDMNYYYSYYEFTFKNELNYKLQNNAEFKKKIESIKSIIYLICAHTTNYKTMLTKIKEEIDRKTYNSFYLSYDSSEIIFEILSKYILHIDLSLLADLKKQGSTVFDTKKSEISAEIQNIGKIRFNGLYNKDMLTVKYPTTQRTPEEFANENGLSDMFSATKKPWWKLGGSKKRKSKKRNAKKNKSKRRV